MSKSQEDQIDQVAWWRDASLALEILAVDPHAIGGVWLSGPRGGALQKWLEAAQHLSARVGPVRRLPVSATDGRLIGELDLVATLACGRPVMQRGLLADINGGIIVVPNVECMTKTQCSILAVALDTGFVAVERDGLSIQLQTRFGTIALDETGEADAAGLKDRLGIGLNFTGVLVGESNLPADAQRIQIARARREKVGIPQCILEGVCGAAFALGINSTRAPVLALHVARSAAALEGRDEVTEEDAAFAARLVFATRATCLPLQAPEDDEVETSPQTGQQDVADENATDQPDLTPTEIEEMLIQAALASLPAGLLKSLRAGKPQAAGNHKGGAGRSGAKQKSQHHGRRARARRGDPRDGAPLDILETLRAAAPWQLLRSAEVKKIADFAVAPKARRLEVRRQDFRVRTFKNHCESVAIFAVDASGSSALHRLAEAKGAIELLLIDCYARRDHVALVAFRGKSAEVILPPTRSLARAKRGIAALPGGGGTPLASAARCATSMAEAVRRKGQTPTIVFLTDGKANIDLAGTASRVRATSDAHDAASETRALGVRAIVIDTSPRPATQARDFAEALGAAYVPLPQANAAQLSQVVRGHVSMSERTS